MSEKLSGISLNTMFRHEGYGCICAVDTVNTSPDEAPILTLKVFPDTGKRLLLSYAPKDGLNVTGVAGSVHEKNILGKLLSLPKGDIDKHIEFIEKYGFLYPLPKNEYTAIEADAFMEVITLIEAIYFSIFYMRNGEMYKECENPNCKRDKFFLVEATRTNKHYCCEQCRNAAGAQRYRNRQL